MPSLRGAGLLAAGAGLLVTGRLFGLAELLYLGTGGLVAVLMAVVVVGFGRARVAVRREITPPRTHAGEQVAVTLDVHNGSAVPTSILEITDRIEGIPRPATFASPAIPPGRRATAAYVLTCRSRGVYDVGPLVVTVTDPFGLARLPRRLDVTTQLAVYPAVVPLVPLPHASARDPSHRSERPAVAAPQGQDFYTLREYQVGDDLRKVHWRSTARRGRLMIRQEELPSNLRGTVVLDVRAAALGAAGETAFESAVIAAASAVQQFAGRGESCRFASTDGGELPFGYGTEHFRAIFDRLAVADDTSQDGFATTLSRLGRRDAAGGALIFCGGILTDDEARRLAALRNRYGPLVVVRHPPSTATGELGRHREAEREAHTDAILRSVGVLVVRPGTEGLTAAWERELRGARTPPAGDIASSAPWPVGRMLK